MALPLQSRLRRGWVARPPRVPGDWISWISPTFSSDKFCMDCRGKRKCKPCRKGFRPKLLAWASSIVNLAAWESKVQSHLSSTKHYPSDFSRWRFLLGLCGWCGMGGMRDDILGRTTRLDKDSFTFSIWTMCGILAPLRTWEKTGLQYAYLFSSLFVQPAGSLFESCPSLVFRSIVSWKVLAPLN